MFVVTLRRGLAALRYRRISCQLDSSSQAVLQERYPIGVVGSNALRWHLAISFRRHEYEPEEVRHGAFCWLWNYHFLYEIFGNRVWVSFVTLVVIFFDGMMHDDKEKQDGLDGP